MRCSRSRKRSYNGASFEGATSASISVKCHRKVLVPTRIDASCLKAAGAREDGGGEPILYELCAINVHDGGIGGGHNMCYRRDCTRTTMMDQAEGKLRQLTDPPRWTWFSDRPERNAGAGKAQGCKVLESFQLRLTCPRQGQCL